MDQNDPSFLPPKLRGKLYISRKNTITNPEGANQHSEEVGYQSDTHPIERKTREIVASETGVSPATIMRDAAYAEAAQLTQSGLCEPRTPR